MTRKPTPPSERSLSRIIQRAEALAKQIPALQQELDELVAEYETRMVDAQAQIDSRVAGLRQLRAQPAAAPTDKTTEAT